jgi:RNA polymerase sigma-70 factor (ECF subfamily)
MNRPCAGDDIPKDVLVAWVGGSEPAFALIVKATMRRAYAVALGFLGNAEDARDVSQEAYVAAHAARKRFDAERPFFPWFYRILRNRCLNALESRARRPEVSLDVVAERNDTGCGPERSHERRETAALVWKALFAIAPEHREVLVLRTFQELSYREIARTLDIPEGTVMSRLFYARQALRGALEALPEFDDLREETP